jgi:hypothetical protein
VLLAVVGLLFAAGTAEAKVRVAVVAFEGDNNGALQEVVTDLLDSDYEVSGTKTVTRTLDKLGMDADLSDKDLKKLANELEVDAILRGDLKQKGTRKLLHIKVYLNGKKVRGFKVEFASAKSEKFKTALKDKIDEKLAGSEGKKKKSEEADASADEEDPISGKKTKKTSKADQEETKAEKTEDSGDAESAEKSEEKSDEEKASADADDEDPDKKKKKKVASADADSEDIGVSKSVTVEGGSGGRAANRFAVRVDVGPSLSTRRLAFTSRAFEEAPKPYGNDPVGGVRVAGEVYPLAFGNPHSIMAGIGLAGHYDQTLKLNLQSSAQPGTKFPVEQKHWSLGLRFRVAVGSTWKAPTITVGGGYFHRKFAVDRSGLMMDNTIDLPDVFYKGWDPGLEFRIPIFKQAALLFGGRALFVTDTGQIQQLYSYGRAKVTSGQATIGLDIVIANRFALRLAGEMAQFGYDFTGNGELTYNRDNDPMTPDIGGAVDRYFGGAATLAVLY